MPAKPIGLDALMKGLASPESAPRLLELSMRTDLDREYLHWDRLRFRRPPDGLTLREWWLAIKFRRMGQFRPIPLRAVDGSPFGFAAVDLLHRQCHEADRRIGTTVTVPDPLTTKETKNRYLVRSLTEEAITSTLLEGAATTREKARDLLRSGRKPRSEAERMIVNNYLTMRRIADLKDRPLTPELVYEIHERVTRDTLEDPNDAGRPRAANRDIRVRDRLDRVLHVPPPAEQLQERMLSMCRFANEQDTEPYVHPIVRAMIVHFWLAYDHPFVDGNGRTARALFYWAMLRYGYWLCEFISVSEIILTEPAKYGRAFLYAETDGNDLTYFLLHQLDVMARAIQALFEFIEQKTAEIHAIEGRLRNAESFNHRQRAVLGHALRHPSAVYTMDAHRREHGVVHQTARVDLLELADRGFLRARKTGRQWRFTPAADLESKLRPTNPSD